MFTLKNLDYSQIDDETFRRVLLDSFTYKDGLRKLSIHFSDVSIRTCMGCAFTHKVAEPEYTDEDYRNILMWIGGRNFDTVFKERTSGPMLVKFEVDGYPIHGNVDFVLEDYSQYLKKTVVIPYELKTVLLPKKEPIEEHIIQLMEYCAFIPSQVGRIKVINLADYDGENKLRRMPNDVTWEFYFTKKQLETVRSVMMSRASLFISLFKPDASLELFGKNIVNEKVCDGECVKWVRKNWKYVRKAIKDLGLPDAFKKGVGGVVT